MPDIDDIITTKPFAAKIAEQNDLFRKNTFKQSTDPAIPKGRLVCTQGISSRDVLFQQRLLVELVGYNSFNEECDPNGWHDMGVLKIGDDTIWFKIDYFDLEYEFGVQDPSDLDTTRRVLTLMFPSEY